MCYVTLYVLSFLSSDDEFLLQAASYFDESAGPTSCCRLIVLTDGSQGSTILFRQPPADQGLSVATETPELSFATLYFQDLMSSHSCGCAVRGVTSTVKAHFDRIAMNILSITYATLQPNNDNFHRLGVIR